MLIIDEVSMVDGLYFQLVEALARYVREDQRSFGGIQLVVAGDFLQLPPVWGCPQKYAKVKNMDEGYYARCGTDLRKLRDEYVKWKTHCEKFAFEVEPWGRCFNRSTNERKLTVVFRQSDDKAY